eukprot:363215-Chlamydomonas_euryale.AAC.6
MPPRMLLLQRNSTSRAGCLSTCQDMTCVPSSTSPEKAAVGGYGRHGQARDDAQAPRCAAQRSGWRAALAAADAVHVQLALFKPVEHLLAREISLERPPVPQRPLERLVLERLWRNWLTHRKHRQRHVGKRVAEVLDLFAARDDFVQLQAYEAGRDGRRGCDRRDDAPCDELGLELVDLWDLVVARAHVGKARDQVHVVVGVVVLLKLDRVEPEARLERRLGQPVQQALDEALVVRRHHWPPLLRLGVRLDVHALLWLERLDHDLGGLGTDRRRIGGVRGALDAVHLCL